MAHIYHADLKPSKTELITAWLRAQPWFEGEVDAEVEKAGAFRFDDPDGRVGVETLLVTAGGPVLQVPLTYRDAPLDGGEQWLLGTMEHSVLGTRHVYDATGDPVYLRALAETAFSGGSQAAEYWEVDGVRTYREPAALANGNGSGTAAAAAVELEAPLGHPISTSSDAAATITTAGALRIAVVRVPAGAASAGDAITFPGATAATARLTGTWPGMSEAVTLATVSLG